MLDAMILLDVLSDRCDLLIVRTGFVSPFPARPTKDLQMSVKYTVAVFV